MAKESLDARIERLNKTPYTDADMKFAKARLDSLEGYDVTIHVDPIPMRGGKYGWTGTVTLDIGGKDRPVSATVVHPAADGMTDGQAAAMNKLAFERRDEIKATNGSIETAFNRLDEAAQAAFLKSILGKAGYVVSKADDVEDAPAARAAATVSQLGRKAS